MAMKATDMAQEVADAMKADGQFDIRNSGGVFEFDQTSYDLTIHRLEVQYNAMIGHIQSNMTVTTKTKVSLNSVIGAGVPVPTDGGLGLQTTQKAYITSKLTTIDVAESTKVE